MKENSMCDRRPQLKKTKSNFMYFDNAHKYLKKNEYNKVLLEYQKGEEHAKKMKDIKMQTFYLCLQASIYMILKKHEKVIDYYKKAIEINPYDAQPYISLGYFYFDTKKDFILAKKMFRNAIKYAANGSIFVHEANILLGLVCLSEKKVTMAGKYLSKSIKEYNGRFGYDTTLAVKLFGLGVIKPVLSYVSEVFKKDPNNKIALVLLCKIMEKQGKRELAIINWKRYLKLKLTKEEKKEAQMNMNRLGISHA